MWIATGADQDDLILVRPNWVDDKVLNSKHLRDAVLEGVEASPSSCVPHDNLLVRPAADEDVLVPDPGAGYGFNEVRVTDELLARAS